MKIEPFDNLTLSQNQLKVLMHLGACQAESEEGSGFYMRHIAKETGIEYRLVRIACRSMARKGLTEYTGPLFDDDGRVAGSGYRATPQGIEVFERVQELARIREEIKKSPL